MPSLTRCDWASAFVRTMGFPATYNTHVALLGWMQGEGSPCRWNPLDTTEPWGGATNCNSAGVKNYPSEQAGLDATAATLKNGYYTAILNAFHGNDHPLTIAAAIANSVWGTKDAVAATQYCISNTNACCAHGVVGKEGKEAN